MEDPHPTNPYALPMILDIPPTIVAYNHATVLSSHPPINDRAHDVVFPLPPMIDAFIALVEIVLCSPAPINARILLIILSSPAQIKLLLPLNVSMIFHSPAPIKFAIARRLWPVMPLNCPAPINAPSESCIVLSAPHTMALPVPFVTFCVPPMIDDAYPLPILLRHPTTA